MMAVFQFEIYFPAFLIVTPAMPFSLKWYPLYIINPALLYQMYLTFTKKNRYFKKKYAPKV